MKQLIAFFVLAYGSCCAEWNVETLSETPHVVVVHNFLSEGECDHLIHLASPSLQRSLVVDESGRSSEAIDSRRSSRGMFLNRSQDPVVSAIEMRLAAFTGIPMENGEHIQILKYEKGGEYQPHYDTFNPETSGGAFHLQRGGQRVASMIMYLNTPLEGGETIFPRAQLAVTPEKGKAVLFYNCLPSGQVDPLSFHGGAPVLAGEKWIATRWFRMSRFD
jgi:prolyl 4-hydroxylase